LKWDRSYEVGHIAYRRNESSSNQGMYHKKTWNFVCPTRVLFGEMLIRYELSLNNVLGSLQMIKHYYFWVCFLEDDPDLKIIWVSYLIKVITETRRAHYIWYLHFLLLTLGWYLFFWWTISPQTYSSGELLVHKCISPSSQCSGPDMIY
jgi:hypothetical protein